MKVRSILTSVERFSEGHSFILKVLIFCVIAGPSNADSASIQIYSERKIADTSHHPIGINLNFLRDDDRNRPAGSRTLVEALREMGVKYLRYPGGEKSNYHLWSISPFEKPIPQVFDRANRSSPELYTQHAAGAVIMNFDEFTKLAEELHATPILTVGATPFGGYVDSAISRDTYLEAAKAWVRYANIKKKLAIKYWEIGNENWQEIKPQKEVEAAIADFSREMKAIDPTILVGASGNTPSYFSHLISTLGDSLDFVTASTYSCNGLTFDCYRNLPGALSPTDAVNALPALEDYAESHGGRRIGLVAAEFNAIDWTMKWPFNNDLGHAIVTCEIFGRLLPLKDFDFGLFWNTRWMDSRSDFTGVPRWSAFYALDSQNRLTPTGRAVAIWGQNLLDEVVEARSSDKLVVFALQDYKRANLNLIIINRDERDQKVSVSIEGQHSFSEMRYSVFSGSAPDDSSPVWYTDENPLPVQMNKGEFVSKGTSITVLKLK